MTFWKRKKHVDLSRVDAAIAAAEPCEAIEVTQEELGALVERDRAKWASDTTNNDRQKPAAFVMHGLPQKEESWFYRALKRSDR